MKKSKLYSLIMLMTLFVFTLAACVESPIAVDIRFDSNGGTEIESVTYNGTSSFVVPENPTKEGYQFDGWFWDNETFDLPFTVNSVLDQPIQSDVDLVIYAKWVPLTFSINYELDGGANDDGNPTTFNILTTSLVIVDPTKEGYTFGGWYLDTEFTTAYSFSTMPAEDITVYAKWNINSYTLQYVNDDNNVLQTEDYTFGIDLSGVVAPEPSKVGHTFTGWDISLPLTMPAGNVTLKAQYSINQYTITFDVDGGSSIESITQDYLTTINSPEEPTKEGYTFGGWYEEEAFLTAYTFTTIPAEDITVYAKWNINSYTLQYVNDDNNVLQTEDYAFGADLSGVVAPEPSKVGHTFTGWDISLPLMMPANNVTLQAQYTINQYTLTFDTNGGSSITEISQDYNSTLLAPSEPTKEGHTFGGWYADDVLTTTFDFTTMPAEDITVYAKWNINQYTINFDSNGGTSVLPIVQDFDTIVIAPVEPAKQGYTFDGWYSDRGLTELYIFTTMPSSFIELYAKWTPNLYEVTFKLNNGESDVIEIDYADSELMIPSYNGYIFDGWYLDSELQNVYESFDFPTINIILYAKWILREYTISYELYGGDNNNLNPEVYTILSDNFMYQAPSKEGHTFIGWYNNELFEGSAITFQLQGTTGDIVLYAKWEINQYDVNYFIYEDYNPLIDIPLYPDESIISIALGGYHTAALTSEGRVFTWGRNSEGQLGDGTTTQRNTPIEITNKFNLVAEEKIINISLGGYYSAALTTTGRVFTWGYNSMSQLGDGSTINKSIPTEITNQFTLEVNEKILSIFLGGQHASAITSLNNIFTWGRNDFGQLGDGTTINRSTPVKITSQFYLNENESIISISFGNHHSSAITSIGRIFTWGWNTHGQLGDGTTSNKYLPTEITNFFNLSQTELIIYISLGTYHSSALTSIGRIFTWGYNGYGQLGDGTTETKSIPTEITNQFTLNGDEKIVEMSFSGMYHSSVTTTLGRVFTWGQNTEGKLGDGTIINKSTPIDITINFDLNAGEIIMSTSLGDSHSSAITSLGHIFTWGRNDLGALGDGTTTNRYTPNDSLFRYSLLVQTDTYNYATNISEYIPIVEGYSFSGWYFDTSFTEQYNFETMPAYDINLVGYWTLNHYIINYNLNGGINNSSNPASYTIENEDIILLTSTKEGYTFQGWYDNESFTGDAITSILQGSTGDLTLYAKWAINSYTITFNTNEGSLIEPITQEYNSTVPAPTNPIRQGYTFAGWFTTSQLITQYTFSSMPAQSITLYAKWNPNVYVTTFVLNNGSDNVVEVDYAGSELLIPTYQGYEFGRWYQDIELTIPYESNKFPTSNMTLYAKWYLIYTITYHLDGGTNDFSNPVTYTSNDSTFELIKPIKEGYIFIGWYTNPEFNEESVTDIANGTIGDITLYAKWTINQYDIKYFVYQEYNPLNDIILVPDETIINISLGDSHSSVLLSTGRIFVWGRNSEGQLGDGTTIDRKTPKEITNQFNLETGEKIINISLEFWHSAAITSTGRLFTWGYNAYGQLGDGTTVNKLVPTEITSRFNLGVGEAIISISLGYYHSAAITSTGRLFTWGYNAKGQLGDGTNVDKLTPTEITNQFNLNFNEKITGISLGAAHSSALTSSGRIFTWGFNVAGQLGDGTNIDKAIPTEITSQFDLDLSEKIKDISLGSNHSSTTTTTGRIFTWGYNYFNQLGDGTTINKSVPTEITNQFNLSPGEIILSSSLGELFSSAITSTGRIFTWGSNSYGQLGDGTTEQSSLPTEITSQFNLGSGEFIVVFSLGASHSSVITSTGRIFTWGINNFDQLGDGSTIDKSTPTEITTCSTTLLHQETYDFASTTTEYIPVLEGYTFNGWYSDIYLKTPYIFTTMPANDVILYSSWIINP